MERKRYQRGKASLAFENGPQILGKASVAGKKEGEGPLGEQFDIIEPDPLLGCENWEEAESALQKEAADLVIERAGLVRERGTLSFRRGSSGAAHCNLLWNRGSGTAAVWIIRGMLHHRGGSLSRGHDSRGWVCGLCDGLVLQPFCQRGKAVPFSVGIRESASAFRPHGR